MGRADGVELRSTVRLFCLEAFGSIRSVTPRAIGYADGSPKILGTRSLRSLISRPNSLLHRPCGVARRPPSLAAVNRLQGKKTRGRIGMNSNKDSADQVTVSSRSGVCDE